MQHIGAQLCEEPEGHCDKQYLEKCGMECRSRTTTLKTVGEREPMKLDCNRKIFRLFGFKPANYSAHTDKTKKTAISTTMLAVSENAASIANHYAKLRVKTKAVAIMAIAASAAS